MYAYDTRFQAVGIPRLHVPARVQQIVSFSVNSWDSSPQTLQILQTAQPQPVQHLYHPKYPSNSQTRKQAHKRSTHAAGNGHRPGLFCSNPTSEPVPSTVPSASRPFQAGFGRPGKRPEPAAEIMNLQPSASLSNPQRLRAQSRPDICTACCAPLLHPVEIMWRRTPLKPKQPPRAL